MGILAKLFHAQKESIVSKGGTTDRRGPLIHIFVFDSGPVIADESTHATRIVRSLLPEAMVYPDVPISFHCDAKMPSGIGLENRPDIKRAENYPLAWKLIHEADPLLVEGLRVGDERCTFACEEYCSSRGHRGILYAFYRIDNQ